MQPEFVSSYFVLTFKCKNIFEFVIVIKLVLIVTINTSIRYTYDNTCLESWLLKLPGRGKASKMHSLRTPWSPLRDLQHKACTTF